MKKGKIIFIMWISWAWKWTLVNNLLKEKSDFKFALSCKTRPKRDFEVDWVDAHFLTEQDFKTRIEAWEFLEYAHVHKGWYYWTLLKDVLDEWIYTWINVISEVEIAWLKEILKNRNDLKEDIISIFLDIPDEEIERRLRKRWESLSDSYLENRLSSAKVERENLDFYDYVIDSHKNNEKEVLEIVLDIVKNK